MRDLWNLENERKHKNVRIIDELQADLQALSDLLQLPDTTVRNLRTARNFTADDGCRSVFQKWLGGEGRQPRTWATLIKVIRELNKRALADKILDILQQ